MSGQPGAITSLPTHAICALGSIRQRVAQESTPPAMPFAPEHLARLRAENAEIAARIAAATRARALKAAKARRVSESSERVVKEKVLEITLSRGLGEALALTSSPGSPAPPPPQPQPPPPAPRRATRGTSGLAG